MWLSAAKVSLPRATTCTMTSEKKAECMEVALAAAREASGMLVKLASSELEIQRKEDGSPVTNADMRAHEIISRHLEPLGIPVVSEEGADTPFEERRIWDACWLVDPLDGTSSYIRMRAGYAVNIALVQRNEKGDMVPILGVVALPDLDELYFGSADDGAFRTAISEELNAVPMQRDLRIAAPYNLLISWNEPATLGELIPGHIDPSEVRMKPISGARKFCLVAEGTADIHARSRGYMEWDCAAGDAVLRALGFYVRDLVTGRPLVYNGPTLRVGGLIASRV